MSIASPRTYKAVSALRPFPVLFPGESEEEFSRLFDGLVDEWEPIGAVERQVIYSLAELLWRRDHLDVSQRMQNALDDFGPVFENKDKPGWNEDIALLNHLKAEAAALPFFAEYLNKMSESQETSRKIGRSLIELAEKGLDCPAEVIMAESAANMQIARNSDEYTFDQLERSLKLKAYIDNCIEATVRFLILLKRHNAAAASTVNRVAKHRRAPRGRYRQPAGSTAVG